MTGKPETRKKKKHFKNREEQNIFDDLFKVVFYEDGHMSYQNGVSNCLIGNNELRQIGQIRKYIDNKIKNSSQENYLSYPSEELRGETTIIIQEKEGNTSSKEDLENYILKNGLNELIVKELTHNRLSIGVKGIGKKSAIKDYNLDLSNSYYFCDEINDLELALMIKNDGGKIISPNNAVKEIKNISYFVSDKPFSYGVVDFLSILLKNSSN